MADGIEEDSLADPSGEEKLMECPDVGCELPIKKRGRMSQMGRLILFVQLSASFISAITATPVRHAVGRGRP
jgi:hypothetical protein